ncbi:tRNA (cytosine(32)/uridine(32)-2'-O)-methyltransferase TrmJ [Motiliproteus sediminis]|uniref:tRNA (cytosine(32)/uridine(32)-2'-O)-methyltransferase TrmJ n=1 Tax=Motiliproteus sediminis TaxID=1468178 RepID=UPI001AEFBC1A|nr:tRNA (cytosine(32)/uridine(32)-2'-O)-methyltransferase TrmJ [Motiliproteus sediminis]
MFPTVRIVLVHTSHPGNIGGVARAMKNMAFENLVLVAPKEFPSEKAEARASGATDVLAAAQVVETLEQAVEGCHLVVGASARGRHIPWPVVDPRELAAQVVPDLSRLKVALVFGREDRGLTNEELQRCHRHVHIPSNPDFSSLNLAAAVQVLCYELRMAVLADQQGEVAGERPRWGTEWDIELATADELERLFEHLETTLVDIDFLDPDNPRQLMPRLRRLYLRSHPDKVEVNVLRGILTAMQKKIGG